MSIAPVSIGTAVQSASNSDITTYSRRDVPQSAGMTNTLLTLRSASYSPERHIFASATGRH